MRVKFTTDYTDERGRFFPKGKVTGLSGELLDTVIKKKKAVPTKVRDVKHIEIIKASEQNNEE